MAKQLKRSSNKLIAGVCAGMAEYIGIDITLMRIIWALCVLVGGFGILAYILFWIIMPAA